MSQLRSKLVAVPPQIAASICLQLQMSSPWLRAQAATSFGLHASVSARKFDAK